MAETGLLTDHNSLSSHEIDYEEQYLPVEHETGRNASRYRTGRWDENEHRQFLQGLQIHGKNWKKIAELVKTRSSVQIRTHAQKFFIKAARQGLNVNYFSRIEQPKNEWTEEQPSAAVELPTGAEDEKNPLNIPLINEDGELFNGLPVQESSSYETKPIDNNRALEPLPIVDFDTTVMTVDDVCTPRMLNVNRLAPSLDEKINQTVHAERPNYKRALDMDDPLNYFSFPADGFYAKAVNQVDAAAPLEFGDCTDLDDELSLVSSETPDVLSCDDNMAFDDKDLDFFFSDELRECKKARLVAGF